MQYFPLPSKTHLKSQTFSLFELPAVRKISWAVSSFVENVVLAACYQSKDEMLMKEVNRKATPVLMVCETSSTSLSNLLTHMFACAFGKLPCTVVNENDVPSAF